MAVPHPRSLTGIVKIDGPPSRGEGEGVVFEYEVLE